MERDAHHMRGERPFLFTNLKDHTGLEEVISWLEHHLKTPPEQRRTIIDAHAGYIPQQHSHDHHTHTH